MKDFFKPTIAKIILFLILMGGLNYLDFLMNRFPAGTTTIGVPSGFWVFGSDMRPGIIDRAVSNFIWINFIIDIIFWYLVSCGVVALYNKIGKKHKNRKK